MHNRLQVQLVEEEFYVSRNIGECYAFGGSSAGGYHGERVGVLGDRGVGGGWPFVFFSVFFFSGESELEMATESVVQLIRKVKSRNIMNCS